ncbi:MAG: AAA family ATPase [Paraglaciecola sp.]|uniref:AAA family ATPase n=1 Tax=Paraglaciecola sp. TaxID=1920173 RepID=UPI003298AC8F
MNKLTNTQNALDSKNDQKVGGVRAAITHLINKIINKNNSIKEHSAGELTSNKSIKTKVLKHTQEAANEPFFQLVNGDLGSLRTTSWLIENWIPFCSLVCTYAPSGSLKSFLVLDQALHVCTGASWNGFPSRKGAVLFIAGEGRNGLIKRVAAWRKHYKNEILENFYLSNTAIELLDSSNVERVIEEAKEIAVKHGEISMIVVDTLNRNFGAGDENKTQDMTTFINAVSRLQSQTNSCVHIVHHTSKADSSVARGSGALRAALDCEFMIDAQKANTDRVTSITVSCKKMKDDDFPEPIIFKPLNIELGNKDGSGISSLVLDSQDTQLETAKKSLIQHIKNCIKECGGNVTENKLNLMTHIFSTILHRMNFSEPSEDVAFTVESLARAYFDKEGALDKPGNDKSRFLQYINSISFLDKTEMNTSECYLYKFKNQQGDYTENFNIIREKVFSQKNYLGKIIDSGFLKTLKLDEVRKA